MTKQELELALEMAVKEYMGATGSCPYDLNDDKFCEKNYIDCKIGLEKKCWKDYFIREARKQIRRKTK